MRARDEEAQLLDRCDAAARGQAVAADQVEANVFRLAALVLSTHCPAESKRLLRLSEQYFAVHPAEKLSSAEVVRQGWVMWLPRLKDALCRRLLRG